MRKSIKFELKKILNNQFNILIVFAIMLALIISYQNYNLPSSQVDDYYVWIEEKINSDENLLKSSLSQIIYSDSELSKIEKDLNLYKDVSLKTDKDSFEIDNITYFNNTNTSILLILLSIIFGMMFVSIDYDFNMNLIINNNPLGYKKYTLRKLLIYIISISTLVIAYSIIRFFIYPFDPNNLIQTSNLYMYSGYSLSLGQFAIIKLLMNIIGVNLVMLLCISIQYIIKNRNLAYSLLFSLLLIQLFLFKSIASQSNLVILRKINIFNLFDSSYLFSSTNFITLFSYIFASYQILIILGLFAVLLLILYLVNRPSYTSTAQSNLMSFIKIRKPKSSFIYESYKLFIKQSSIIVVIIGIIVGVSYLNTSEFIDTTTFHYNRYANSISGVIDKNVDDFIVKERKYFDEILQDRENLNNKYSLGLINTFEYEKYNSELAIKLVSLEAFEEISSDYNQIISNGGEYFINQRVYNKLIDLKILLSILLITSIISAFSLFNYGSIEEESSMLKVMNSTSRNFKSINRTKIKLIFFQTMFVVSVLYTFNLFYIFAPIDKVSLLARTASILSIKSSIDISILLLLFLIFAILLVISFLISYLIYYISQKNKSSISALSTGLGISVLIYLLMYFI